jgi:hypothetical protein
MSMSNILCQVKVQEGKRESKAVANCLRAAFQSSMGIVYFFGSGSLLQPATNPLLYQLCVPFSIRGELLAYIKHKYTQSHLTFLVNFLGIDLTE